MGEVEEEREEKKKTAIKHEGEQERGTESPRKSERARERERESERERERARESERESERARAREGCQWCLFGSGAASNEAEAHPVILPAAACSHRHTHLDTHIQ